MKESVEKNIQPEKEKIQELYNLVIKDIANIEEIRDGGYNIFDGHEHQRNAIDDKLRFIKDFLESPSASYLLEKKVGFRELDSPRYFDRDDLRDLKIYLPKLKARLGEIKKLIQELNIPEDSKVILNRENFKMMLNREIDKAIEVVEQIDSKDNKEENK